MASLTYIIRVYAKLIAEGVKTLEDVPENIRPLVEELINPVEEQEG